MHPILYSELKQTQREYKPFLFLIFVLVASRAALGDYGHILNLFVIYPIIAGTLGIGLLAQEYSKDYMKYLFTLPIKRWHFILIKMINTIVFAGLFLLIIYVIKWLIPPRFTIPMLVFPTIFNFTYLVIFAMTIALFNYAVCTFTITFLRSPKLASSLNYILLVIALVYLGYYFVDTGYKYKTLDYVLIFAPASLTLTFGGFYLFTLRNPFLNRNPRHFLTGILIAAMSIAFFAGTTQLVVHEHFKGIFAANENEDDFEFERGIESYSISPDGEFVFVQTSHDLLITHSYILSSSGKLVADLGKNSSSPEFYNFLPWQFNNDKRMIVYNKEKRILSAFNTSRFIDYFVLDIDSQKQYEFEHIADRKPGGQFDYDYKSLNNQTMEFSIIGHVSDSDPMAGLCVFKQNIVTNSVREILIPDSETVWPGSVKYVDFERIVFYKRLNQDMMEGGDRYQVNVFDVEERKADSFLLPDGTSYDDYIINGDDCYFLERLSDEVGYSYRVLGGTIGDLNEIYLTPEELPKVSYKRLAEEYYYVGVSFYISPQKNWVTCYYKDRDEQPRLMLLDKNRNRICTNIEMEGFPHILFAPGEMRFYAYRRSSDKDDSEKNIIRIYDIVDRQVVFVKEIEIEENSSDIRFLNDNTMIYIKNPTPEEDWINNKYLVRFNLDTLEATPFFGQSPEPVSLR